MPRTLKISISGVRGVVGESLTPQLLVTFAQAFGQYVGRGDIMIGRDTRATGPMVRDAVVAGLLSCGCRPIDLGVVPTPTLLIKTAHSEALGGIAITASHNPIEWNALKFVNGDGYFLDEHQAGELLDVYHQGEFLTCPNDEIAALCSNDSAIGEHIDRVVAHLDTELIKNAGMVVAVDCCNGAGSEAVPALLDRLGVKTVAINCTPDGAFPHDPEPVAANVSELCDTVVAHNTDIGFVLDADADRLAIVSEKGVHIGEEYTLAIVAEHLLRKNPGRTVVANVSTTRALDEISAGHGSKVVRTRVGEANVAEGILRENAIVGGEGNGGVMFPGVHTCWDGLTGIGLVLQHLAETGTSVSEIVDSMPKYVACKKKFPCRGDKASIVLNRLRRRHEHDRVALLDGIQIEWDDSWVNIRKSNTEPILRVTAEAPNKDQARALASTITSELEEILASL